MSILATHALTIGYAHRTVATDIHLTLVGGELVCLVGTNGVGKSTLLRTLGGMQKPLSGKITLLGDDLFKLSALERARRLSLVLTQRVEGNLLTGYALVALGRHPYTAWNGALSAQDKAVIQWAVEAVGAEAYAARPVAEMSDGERQKIMIARALAQEPQLMLLDEPTAFLDLPRRVEMMHLLKKLAHTTQRAILLSTHDLDLALRTADRIWLMSSEGQLAAGAPEDLILSGAFEAAFQSEGVTFDPHTGSFKLAAHQAGEISLEGEGLPAFWTKRGLERAGFSIVPTAPCSVQVLDQKWQLTTPKTRALYTTIYDLLQALQQEKKAHA